MMAFDDYKWKAEKTVNFSVRLQRSTDADIVEYLEKHAGADSGLSRTGIVKKALREYIANHKE